MEKLQLIEVSHKDKGLLEYWMSESQIEMLREDNIWFRKVGDSIFYIIDEELELYSIDLHKEG